MTKNLMIIGGGGVASVAVHKCAVEPAAFKNIVLASRTTAKLDAIAASVRERHPNHVPLTTVAVDAMDSNALEQLIREHQTDIVLNLGSAFLNMSVLEACIRTGAAYIDTAIHEDPQKSGEAAPWYANYEWKRKAECAEKGITAVLGCGFDPGVVNAYAVLGMEHLDHTTDIDIIDINAGSHKRYFATNFDPEINFREFIEKVVTFQNGQWVYNDMFEVKRTDDLPVVGVRDSYLCGHDEIHSLAVNTGVANIRFWMGFGEHYINVFNVLKNIGLLGIKPVKTAEGVEVVPLKVVKALLPDPASLAAEYEGKTFIGVKTKGIDKNGKEGEVFIYNICDHQETYAETGNQAISYTAGVPAAAAAVLIAEGKWDVGKMVNVEELPPYPFIEQLDRMGIKTRIVTADGEDKPISG